MKELVDLANHIATSGGPFATGAVFSAVMYYFAGREARQERAAARKNDFEREKLLQEQLSQQQDRVNKLHSDKELLLERANLADKEIEKLKKRLQDMLGDRLL